VQWTRALCHCKYYISIMKCVALCCLLPCLLSGLVAAQNDATDCDHVSPDSTRHAWHATADRNGEGLWVVAWSERRHSGTLVRAAFLERGQQTDIHSFPCGTMREGVEDTRPSVTFLGDSTVLLAWQRREAGTHSIYIRILQRNGTAGEAIPVQQVQADGMIPASGRCTRDGVLVAWQDYRNGNADVYARRIGGEGLPHGPELLINDDGTSAIQGGPSVAKDNRNGHLLLWPDNRHDGTWKFYCRRLDGRARPNALVDSAQRKAMTTVVNAVCISEDTAYVFWKDYRAGDSNIYRRIADLDRGTFSSAERINDDAGDRWQRLVVAAGDGKGNVVACWEDYRNTENNQRGDIFLQVFNRDGTPRGRNIKVNDRDDRIARKMPAIAMDADGWYLLLWHQGEHGTFDIAGQWFRYPAERAGSNFLLTARTN
jgi:hypothetical protein